MSGFFLSFLAVLLASIGARDVATVAGLSARQGARPALLLVAAASAGGAAAVMGWAANAVLPLLAEDARGVMAAITLAVAGAEMLVLRARPLPAEPTESLGAGALVLLAQQLTDAARFMIFGIGIGLAAPVSAAAGGALGGAAAMLGAWLGGERLLAGRVAGWRRAIGAALLVLALAVAARTIPA